MNRSLKTLALALALSLTLAAACGGEDEQRPDPNDPDTGTATSHLGGPSATYGVCDNPEDSPKTCYAYTSDMWAGQAATTGCADLKGTYSKTQGCSATGRGGRCTLMEGTSNEYVAHCYFSTADCQRTCSGVGTFEAN